MRSFRIEIPGYSEQQARNILTSRMSTTIGTPEYEREITKDWLTHNVYGILKTLDKTGAIPIMCGCGGSMYLCRKHALEMLNEEKLSDRKQMEFDF